MVGSYRLSSVTRHSDTSDRSPYWDFPAPFSHSRASGGPTYRDLATRHRYKIPACARSDVSGMTKLLEQVPAFARSDVSGMTTLLEQVPIRRTDTSDRAACAGMMGKEAVVMVTGAGMTVATVVVVG
jgi:hypothetical protein